MWYDYVANGGFVGKTMIKIRFGVVAALVAALMIATPALAAKRDNSIRWATDNVLNSIDGYFNDQKAAYIVALQVWDTLIYRDPKTNEYKGQLATSWKSIDDRTIEFELRRGVKFHNGADFDADDVVYTLNYISNPENKVVVQSRVSWIDHAEKIDPYKVRVVSKETFPAAIEFLAVYSFIYPHEYYAKVGPIGMSERPVGSGPFRVVEHARGKYVRMERNRDYFKDSPRSQPKIDKLEIRFIPDVQTQIAEVLAGGLDMIWNVPVDQAQQLRAVASLQVVPGETNRVAFLHLNSSERTPAPPLRDIRVRKAVMHAINREAMLKSMVGEGARIVDTMCYPTQFGCIDKGVPRYAYDPAGAKQLLVEAGYPDGFDVDLYAYRDRAQTEAMIGYLRAVGIRANLRYLQLGAMYDARRAGKIAMEHFAYGVTVQDISAFTPVMFGGLPDDMNRDGEVRDLLNRGNTSLDPNTRKDAYAKALALIAERAYALPLFSLPTYYVASKDLAFTAHSDENIRFWEMSWK
jgi:peptide/nickel transport system substrate-binding protein